MKKWRAIMKDAVWSLVVDGLAYCVVVNLIYRRFVKVRRNNAVLKVGFNNVIRVR